MNTFEITNQKNLRQQFWAQHPNLPRKKITDYAGKGEMYQTDTRVAFTDWLDYQARSGAISQELADRATL